MDPFSYLSVLLSIILGLAITQLLQGIGRVIQARERVVIFWPSIAWACLLILISVQTWWALFSLRVRTEWSFFPFLLVVLQTVSLYLTTALVLPEIAPGERVDLRAHYFAQATWFFSFAIAMVVISLLKQKVLSGSLPLDPNTIIQLGFIAVALSAIFIRRDWYHKLMLVLSIALFGFYIVILFTRLPAD
jgi:hypothetical protein